MTHTFTSSALLIPRKSVAILEAKNINLRNEFVKFTSLPKHFSIFDSTRNKKKNTLWDMWIYNALCTLAKRAC